MMGELGIYHFKDFWERPDQGKRETSSRRTARRNKLQGGDWDLVLTKALKHRGGETEERARGKRVVGKPA